MKKIIVFASFALFFLFAPVTFAYYPTEKIINGGFENTPLGTGWYQSYGSAIGSHGGGWHSGSYGAKLGINYTTEYIYQDVDIPADATSVDLAYWYRWSSSEYLNGRSNQS